MTETDLTTSSVPGQGSITIPAGGPALTPAVSLKTLGATVAISKLVLNFNNSGSNLTTAIRIDLAPVDPGPATPAYGLGVAIPTLIPISIGPNPAAMPAGGTGQMTFVPNAARVDVYFQSVLGTAIDIGWIPSGSPVTPTAPPPLQAGGFDSGMVQVPSLALTTINIGTPTGGNFNLTSGGVTGSNIAYGASAAALITGLPSTITSNEYTAVTGPNGGPWTIAWAANQTPPAITLNANLSNGSTMSGQVSNPSPNTFNPPGAQTFGSSTWTRILKLNTAGIIPTGRYPEIGIDVQVPSSSNPVQCRVTRATKAGENHSIWRCYPSTDSPLPINPGQQVSLQVPLHGCCEIGVEILAPFGPATARAFGQLVGAGTAGSVEVAA